MRTYDVEEFNAVANDPRVRPWLGFSGHLDFTALLDDPRHLFLSHRGGLAIVTWTAPNVYECHLLFRPEAGGKVGVSRDMAEWMFDYGARMLWGQPMLSNRAARWHIRQIGFKPAGIGEHPDLGPVEYLVMENPSCLPL